MARTNLLSIQELLAMAWNGMLAFDNVSFTPEADVKFFVASPKNPYANAVAMNVYGGREKPGYFRAMTLAEAKALNGGHIWALANDRTARSVKVNGAVKLWKRTPDRIEIPWKYGLYEYGRFDANDIEEGRLLVRLPDNPREAGMLARGSVPDGVKAESDV